MGSLCSRCRASPPSWKNPLPASTLNLPSHPSSTATSSATMGTCSSSASCPPAQIFGAASCLVKPTPETHSSTFPWSPRTQQNCGLRWLKHRRLQPRERCQVDVPQHDGSSMGSSSMVLPWPYLPWAPHPTKCLPVFRVHYLVLM